MKVFQIQMETGGMKVFWVLASVAVIGAVLSAADHDWVGLTVLMVCAILCIVAAILDYLADKGTRN